MGVAIDNANEIVKAFTNNHELLVKTMVHQSMRISSLENLDYKISMVMATSASGKKVVTSQDGEEQFQEPLDCEVTLNFKLNEFPHMNNPNCQKNIKMSTNADKFLMFVSDIEQAIQMMETIKQM